MSIRGQFAKAAADIFTAFGDVPVDCTLRKLVETTYNTTTGEVDVPTDEFESQVILIDYDQREVDGESVRTSDVKGIIRQATLDGETPNVNDKLQVGDRLFDIINVGEDPAGALWMLQLRTSDA